MVVKKKKTVKKTKVTKTDVKQNKAITLLKKKLKELAVKYLKKQKKKLPKTSYDKIKNAMIKKISTTKNIRTLEKLLDTLTNTPINKIPSKVAEFLPSSKTIVKVVVEQAKEQIKEKVNKRSPTVINNFNSTKSKYNELKEKYENGNLNPADFYEMYIEARKLARDVNEVLPSREEVSNLYRTVKSQLNFFKNFINRNLINRNQDGVSDPSPRNPTSPPTPPPDDDDTPPPPSPPPSFPPSSPPPPPPSSSPSPMPTLATPINLETSMIGNLPYAVLGGGAMLAVASASLATAASSFRRTQNRRHRSGEDPVLRQSTAVNRERTNIPIDREATIAEFKSQKPKSGDIFRNLALQDVAGMPEYDANMDPLFSDPPQSIETINRDIDEIIEGGSLTEEQINDLRTLQQANLDGDFPQEKYNENI